MNQASILTQLNLTHLRALDALLAERSVTRAAQRLGLTQSAVSHALRGLRHVLDDPLLVRGTGGMVPTAHAEALAAPLHRALRELESALATSPGFDPATTRRTFTLAMGDGYTLTVLPALLRALRTEAPGIDVDVRPAPGGLPGPALARGDVDLALGVATPPGAELRTRALFDDDFAVMVRHDHPEIDDHIDLDTYCRLPHALMSPSGSGPGVMDRLLGELGRSRRVVLRIRYFLAAPLVVADSDLILTGPRRQLEAMARIAPVRILDPPLASPTFTHRMLWHARAHDDPGHRWLRRTLRAAVDARSQRVGWTR